MEALYNDFFPWQLICSLREQIPRDPSRLGLSLGCLVKTLASYIVLNCLILKHHFVYLSLSVNCDPCDSAELLPQAVTTSSADLQALALPPLPTLPDPSCAFRPEEASYQDTLVSEQPLDLGQAFMASQMSDINISMADGMQGTPGSEVANRMIER